MLRPSVKTTMPWTRLLLSLLSRFSVVSVTLVELSTPPSISVTLCLSSSSIRFLSAAIRSLISCFSSLLRVTPSLISRTAAGFCWSPASSVFFSPAAGLRYHASGPPTAQISNTVIRAPVRPMIPRPQRTSKITTRAADTARTTTRPTGHCDCGLSFSPGFLLPASFSASCSLGWLAYSLRSSMSDSGRRSSPWVCSTLEDSTISRSSRALSSTLGLSQAPSKAPVVGTLRAGFLLRSSSFCRASSSSREARWPSLRTKYSSSIRLPKRCRVTGFLAPSWRRKARFRFFRKVSTLSCLLGKSLKAWFSLGRSSLRSVMLCEMSEKTSTLDWSLTNSRVCLAGSKKTAAIRR